MVKEQLGTSGTESPVERAELLHALNRYHTAMVDARTDVLDEMLEKDFALVHITGYVQPKKEWLAVVHSGDFDYHAIRLDESATNIKWTTNGAVLKGRGIFNATISGIRNAWRLQFTISMEMHLNCWRLKHARYITY